MSEQRTITVYRYAELRGAARELARKAILSDGYSGADEAIATMRALCEHFGCQLADYRNDWGWPAHSTITVEGDREDATAEQVAALSDGSGACVLTGYWLDEEARDALAEAWADGVRKARTLAYAGCKGVLRAAAEDWAHAQEDSAVSDLADANEWRFLVNGRFAPKEGVWAHQTRWPLVYLGEVEVSIRWTECHLG